MDAQRSTSAEAQSRPVAIPECARQSSRLQALVRLLADLDEQEWRLLPLVLSEQILERERSRARALAARVGERCDVDWSGQAELWDVILAAVDVETGLVRVQRSPRDRGVEVPASCVIPHG